MSIPTLYSLWFIAITRENNSQVVCVLYRKVINNDTFKDKLYRPPHRMSAGMNEFIFKFKSTFRWYCCYHLLAWSNSNNDNKLKHIWIIIIILFFICPVHSRETECLCNVFTKLNHFQWWGGSIYSHLYPCHFKLKYNLLIVFSFKTGLFCDNILYLI